MASFIALVAVYSAVLATAKPAALSAQQVASPCIRDSFRIPSWFIQDFHVDAGNASFHILNRATNYSAEIQCPNPSKNAKDCSVKSAKNSTALQVAVDLGDNSAGISVNQSWVCADANSSHPSVVPIPTLFRCKSSPASCTYTDKEAWSSIKFAAFGNASTPLHGGNGTRSRNSTDIPILIRGSLTSPIRITPIYARGPIGHDFQGCAANSKSPSWTLRSVYYLNQTGDGAETALPGQNLMLQIINPGTGHQASCTGILPSDLSSAPAKLSCSGGNDPTGRDRYQVTTDVVFEPTTFRFTINQTWFCDDVNPAEPIQVSASGSKILDLNCTTVLTPIKGSSESSNTTTCFSESIPINGTVVSQKDLPPYSLEDPNPIPDACTITSMLSPAWSLSNFESDGANTSTSVGFSIELETPSNQFQFPVNVMQPDVPTGGSSTNASGSSEWTPCRFGPGEEPFAPHSCSFQYDVAKKDLSIKAEWICQDLDPDNPITFEGTTTTAIPDLGCKKTGDRTRCETAVGRPWLAEISDVHYSQNPPEQESQDQGDSLS